MNRIAKHITSLVPSFIISLIVLLIAGVIYTPGFALGQRKTSKPNKPVRAKRIDGIQCRLKPNKFKWQENETPKFKAYISNKGSDNLWLVIHTCHGCQLEIDGIWHRWVGPEWTGFGDIDQSDWLAKVGGYLSVSLNKRYWQSITDKSCPNLRPGRHTIRLAWAGYQAYNDGSNREDHPILLSSNHVRIKILQPSDRTIKTQIRDEQRAWVTDLFHSFARKEAITDADKQTGIKIDLRPFHHLRPKFTWADIPVLLELAESNKIMTGHIPALTISSYLQKQCREGMVALWLIEGIRRKQAALMKQEQTGEEFLPRTFYDPPLNPICIKGPPDDYANLLACEKSHQIHRETLEAYRQWWRIVGSLPPREAAVFYPLDLTDLRWYGGGRHDEPLEIYDKMSLSGTVAQKIIRTWKYIDNKYRPGNALQTIYYTLKDQSAQGPFSKQMLAVQKVSLHFYDECGRKIRTKSIVPLSGQL